jgi:hypothetical protein
MAPKTARRTKSGTKSPPRGRPRVKDPSVTYAGKTYVVTTFRLSKLAMSQAVVIMETLGLSTRTAAVQYALGQVFRTLHETSGQSERVLKSMLSTQLRALGP